MFSVDLREQLQHRLGYHFVAVMRDIDARYRQRGNASIRALARFREEWDQVRSLWAQLLRDSHPTSSAICTQLAATVERIFLHSVVPSECIAHLEPTLARVHSDTPVREHLSILYQLGEAHHAAGDNPQARQYFDRALALSSAYEDRHYLNRIYNGIAQQLYRTSHLAESMAFSERVLEPTSGADDDQRADALRCIGRCQLELAQYDRAQATLDEAIRSYEQAENLLGMARVYNNRAVVALYTGDFSGARRFLAQSLSIAHKLDHHRLIADVMNTEGIVARRAGFPDEAIYYYRQALEFHEAAESRLGYSQVLNNLGTVLFMQGEDERAIDYFERALATRLIIHDRTGAASSVSNLCQTWNRMGRFDASLACIRDHLELVRTLEGRPQTVMRIIALVTRALSEREADAGALASLVGFVRANQHLDAEIADFIAPAEDRLRHDLLSPANADAAETSEDYRGRGERMSLAGAFDLLERLIAAAVSTRKQ